MKAFKIIRSWWDKFEKFTDNLICDMDQRPKIRQDREDFANEMVKEYLEAKAKKESNESRE